MRFLHGVVIICGSLVLMGAAKPRREPPPPPPPPAVAPGETSKVLDFQRLAFRIPIGTAIGRIRCENGRMLESRDIALTGTPTDLGAGDFRPGFLRAAQAQGYRLIQSATSVFGSADGGSDAQLIVGASISKLFVDACVEFTLLTGPPNATGTITLDWEVYDPVQRQVIYSTSTSGTFKGRGSASGIAIEALVGAFADATTALLRDPGFHALAVSSTLPVGTTQPSTPAAATVIARLPPAEAAFQQQAEAVLGQVVTVLLGESHGSGFFIADGLILTNQHVVGLSQYVKIRMKSGKEVVGEVVSRDSGRDVAIVKTESVGARGLPLRTEEPGVGAPVFVIGTPLDPKLSDSVSSGIVSGFREMNTHRYIQSEANIQPGNSGGPMLDEHGNVIGISVLARLNDQGGTAGINFFIPIREALQTLNVSFAPQ